MTTTNTTEPKHRTITLTDRAPVRIREDHWPLIASGAYRDWNNEDEVRATCRWNIDIHVRQHDDGRAIVYGVYSCDTRFRDERAEAHRVGELVPADNVQGNGLAPYIRRVADALIERVADQDMHRHVANAANECIADLPVQEL